MIVNDHLTDRQRTSLSLHLHEAQDLHGLSDTVRIEDLSIQYREEVRPGRGHDIVYSFVDGDHAFTGGLDPYGGGYMVMAEITITHNSSDEECPCTSCVEDRNES